MNTKGRRKSSNVRYAGKMTKKDTAKMVLGVLDRTPGMKEAFDDVVRRDIAKSQALRKRGFVGNFVGAPR